MSLHDSKVEGLRAALIMRNPRTAAGRAIKRDRRYYRAVLLVCDAELAAICAIVAANKLFWDFCEVSSLESFDRAAFVAGSWPGRLFCLASSPRRLLTAATSSSLNGLLATPAKIIAADSSFSCAASICSGVAVVWSMER